MLRTLSIENVVVIDKVSISFDEGLCVLSGETGAGKSILLDSLGLALGARAETSLIRQGQEKATVTCAFELPRDHSVITHLDEAGIDAEDMLIVRRDLNMQGRSRAFINDHPVSVATLKTIGNLLVDIHGQFDQLLDGAQHRMALDAFSQHGVLLSTVQVFYAAWKAASERLEATKLKIQHAQDEKEFLEYALGELEKVDPQEGEEKDLVQQRSLLMNYEKIYQSLQEAQDALDSGDVERTLASALKSLGRAQALNPELATPITEALERAQIEVTEATQLLAQVPGAESFSPEELERIDERLFSLKGLARKHQVPVHGLHLLRNQIAEKFQLLDDQSGSLALLEKEVAQAQAAYLEGAEKLSDSRAHKAVELDKAVNERLPNLKLEKATFETVLTRMSEDRWSEYGLEQVAFHIATNPGSAPGPLKKIASGGERSRFMLALKSALAQTQDVPTLIFDEADSGVGGATASAIGDHLAELAQTRQVLSITHSPQVAAKAAHHWKIEKSHTGATTATQVHKLADAERSEEVARMLAGAEVTPEARAAAAKLLEAV